MDNIKSCDAFIIALCKDVLEQKFLRCNYVAYMWKHAHIQDPLPDTSPTMHGWQESEGLYIPVLFKGSQVPLNLSETITSSDRPEDEESDNDEDCLNRDRQTPRHGAT